MINPINDQGIIIHRKFDNDDFHFEVVGTNGGKSVWDCEDTLQLIDRVTEKKKYFTRSRRTWYNKFKQ